jgi:ketosteroid isomerase-like protein
MKSAYRALPARACSAVSGCLILIFSIVEAQTLRTPPESRSVEANIRALLDAQTQAWNAGKIEEFMEGYWRSPKLTFFSAGRKLEGWDQTIERYRKSYQGEGKEMGKLNFSELDIQVIGPEGALVRGRWTLVQSDGKEPGGLFTLIFRKFKEGPYGGWKIIHDHTSSNQ